MRGNRSVRRREPLTNATLLMLISIGVFIVMYGTAFFLMSEKGFSKPKMMFDLLNENGFLIILACSLTVVMIGGGINISVGGVVGLTAMSCALMLQNSEIPCNTITVNLTFLLALGIGLAFGLFMGYLISYLEIQPFIVTLAGMVLARGLTTVLSTKPINVTHADFKALIKTKIEFPWLQSEINGVWINGKLEIGAAIALLMVVLIYLLMRKTKLGRNIYAIGGNQQSAMMLGINVKRTRFYSYVISGVLSGLAGFVFLMHTPKADTALAARSEMDAIASSIIGGTLLTGGVGNVFGSFFGAMILSTIQKIMLLSDVKDAWWQNMASGAMLGLFIVLQSIVLSVRGKGKIRLPDWLKFTKPKGEPISPAK